MCRHDDFEVIYYTDGIMFRRCKGCGQIEMRLDQTWRGLQSILYVLNSLQMMLDNK